MKFQYEGILDTSVHHFAQPSAFAQEHLIYVNSMGRYDVTASYLVHRFNYNSFLMLVMTQGNLGCQFNHEFAALGPGDVLLLDCRKPHTYYALGAASFYFIHFGGKMVPPLYDWMHAQSPLVIAAAQPERFTDAMQALLDAAAQRGRWSEPEVSARVYGLLMALTADTAAHRRTAEGEQLAADAKEYILAHLSEKLTVESMAAHWGYSPSHFTQLFRLATGYSPHRYLMNARLDHSRHLLSTTHLDVQEIAAQSGFANHANFSYAFRRAFGITPSEFRKHPV